MPRPYSPELHFVVEEAIHLADQQQREPTSLHLFLSALMVPNSCLMLIEDMGYTEDHFLPYIHPSIVENPSLADDVLNEAEAVADMHRSREVNCLHLLIGFLRMRNCLARQLMAKANVSFGKLRTKAIAMMNDKMPARYRKLFDDNRRNQEKMLEAARLQGAGTPSAPRSSVGPNRQPGRNPQSAQAPNPQNNGALLPYLTQDLTAWAAQGKLDEVIGRDNELSELMDILNKRRANNALVVGEPGIGKTSLVHGLALQAAREDCQLPGLQGRRILELDLSTLTQGTGMRGALSERISQLKQEVRQARHDVVIFLDNLHHLFGFNVDGLNDFVQDIKSALDAGEFPCIATTTPRDLRDIREQAPAFVRCFHPLELKEPNPDATFEILNRLVPEFEGHHNVTYSAEVQWAAIQLSNRYLKEQHQPDKALSLIDFAGSRAQREQRSEVTVEDVAERVHRLTAVPMSQLVLSDTERYLSLASRLSKRIVGHEQALENISRVLQRNAAGFAGDRPIGSFLFAGPTGVGKTEVARALAMELFDSPDAMLRYDMSEFSEAHSTSKLIGAPPGYVGYREGGSLVDTVRQKPFQLILFDEFEKCHPDVQQILLQLLDAGRLTDSHGKTTDFTHTVVIMTSNLGVEAFERTEKSIGFMGSAPDKKDTERQVIEIVRRSISPELFNRIDEKFVFGRLSKDEVAHIARLQLEQSAEKLWRERRIELDFDPEVFEHLVSNGGWDPRYGARPMRRTIQNLVEAPLSNMILKGEVQENDAIRLRPVDDGFYFVRLKGNFRKTAAMN